MVRPQKGRDIKEPPCIQSFKPTGIPRVLVERVELKLDEFEAIRLADYEGLEHKEASERMGISRSTFSRLIDKAHNIYFSFVIYYANKDYFFLVW